MEPDFIILKGEEYTLKALNELADEKDCKIIVYNNIEELEIQKPRIAKIGIVCSGFMAVSLAQLAKMDRKKLEIVNTQPPKKPDTHPIIESLMQEVDRRYLMENFPMEIPKDFKKSQIREVKHNNAKPVKSPIIKQRNPNFKRK